MIVVIGKGLGQLFFVLLLLIPSIVYSDILHLELGAANYSSEDGNDPKRFLFLQKTVEDLIREHGSKGTIYLNDIDKSGLELAERHLKNWLRINGYEDIKVVSIHGDYSVVKLPRVKTAQLGNPGDGQLRSLDIQEARQITATLERIAQLSETGLQINTYFHEIMENFDTTLSESKLISTGRSGHKYHFPEGNKLDRKTERIYLLIPIRDVCRNALSKIAM